MATHKLGKLKFNLSKQGLAYRWGEGEIHRVRLPFNKPEASTENEYDDMYAAEYEEGAYAGEGYDGYPEDEAAEYEGYDDNYDDGYDREDDYADDGYGDYDDQAYADDQEYDDPGYEDDYYDDDYVESDYDDRDYDDDGYDRDYDDGYGEYDDRYSDEDANEAYEGGYYEGENALLRYVDENDWVTYLLLVLLPPLGIYLLWRRGCFERLVRIIVSVISAIWFVIALILLFSLLFGGQKDDPSTVTMPPVSVMPTVTATATPKPTMEPAAEVSVSPTPLSGGASGGSSGTTQYVYSPASGLYYHNDNTCANIGSGISTSRVPVEIAKNSRNQTACPLCVTGTGNADVNKAASGSTTLYYATSGGTYYHSISDCSDMRNATQWTKESAESRGKKPCPVCVTKTQQSVKDGDVKLLTSADADHSNIQVYATKGGTYFHMTSNCSGMQGASKGSLKNALLYGKKACPTCCKAAGTLVYCTKGGTYYHLESDCSGMKGAAKVTLAEAMVLGKSKCTKCIKGTLNTGTTTTPTQTNEYYVYGTKNGQYYHTNSTCSGMSNAKKYTLKSMIAANREPCPVCAGSANTTVYAKQGGTYYHSYATCSGMSHATAGTMAEAMAYGFKRCPKCWSSSGSSAGSSASSGASPNASAGSVSGNMVINNNSGVVPVNTGAATAVYATRNGKYYHANGECSGMKNASKISLATAVNAGKSACPTCLAAANVKVFSTDNGRYYHSYNTCSGMSNAQQRTLAQAMLLNQQPCPQCVGTGSAGTAASDAAVVKGSNTFKTGTSGIKVYALLEGTSYHTKADCSGMKGASYVTLETALNYGKTACTECLPNATRTVFATQNGRYYHVSQACAGSGAKSGRLDAALAYGYQACPYCVTKQAVTTVANNMVYKSGTSGIKVYATIEGPYFHTKSNCSGMKNASLITLETALNYAKTGCPKCADAANATVYATNGSKYYHYDRNCAGSNALAGTLAKARAFGMSPCSKCTSATAGTGGITNSMPVSYSAPADSGVYIDLNSSNLYYHKSANCGTTGTAGATQVTLQYAKDWGYKTCPYCNPPTGISA